MFSPTVTHVEPQTRSQALTAIQARLFHEYGRSSQPARQLMTWLLDRRNLEAAWQRVAAAQGADTPGVDGVRCRDIDQSIDSWLSDLADDLLRRRYRPRSIRWVAIPKPNKPGETRRLGILTVRDRVVHAAIKQVLEPIIEPKFLTTSFGFRPGRCVAGALAEAVRGLSSNGDHPPQFIWVRQLDIAQCFDSLDHEILAAELNRYVADPDLLHLIHKTIATGATITGRLWWRRRLGVTQGSPLSPLLCNLYLHPLDVALDQLAASLRGGVRLLRYADDLLLLASERQFGERASELIRHILKKLRLKCRQPSPDLRQALEGVEWLGVRLQPKRRTWSPQKLFGYVIPDAKILEMFERIKEMTEPPSSKIDSSAFNIGRWIVSVNEQLRDWRQAYRFADNAADVFADIDDLTRSRVFELIKRITGSSADEVYRRFKVRLPRGFWTWEVPGARLVILSSLAPHAPSRLTHKPAWMKAAPDRVSPVPQQAAPPNQDVPALPPPPKADTPQDVTP
ncbi:MAG: hypothetical protein KatS3mg105_2189 [Gemmatales bacterium]|nr:MAG: hypothetical protein KatS3mg105_2189 [Gemmatales bacterium]